MNGTPTIQTILWMDDKIEVLASTVAEIARYNFAITTAESSVEAIEKIRVTSVDCVIVDVKFGGDTSSWAMFLEAAKSVSPNLTILVVTNYPQLPDDQVGNTKYPVVRKSDFVDSPMKYLDRYANSPNTVQGSPTAHKSTYADTIPTLPLAALRYVPNWELLRGIAATKITRILATIPFALQVFALLREDSEVQTVVTIATQSGPVLLGYLLLLVFWILSTVFCPTLVSEYGKGVVYYREIYSAYLNDTGTSAEINSSSPGMDNKPDHWRIRKHFNRDCYKAPFLRSLLTLFAAMGIVFLLWPSWVNLEKVWSSDIAPLFLEVNDNLE